MKYHEAQIEIKVLGKILVLICYLTLLVTLLLKKKMAAPSFPGKTASDYSLPSLRRLFRTQISCLQYFTVQDKVRSGKEVKMISAQHSSNNGKN